MFFPIIICFALIFVLPGYALDFQGRIDTRYEFKKSDDDRSNVQEIYQFHSFDINFTEKFSIEWFGALKKSFRETEDDSGMSDQSDVAFRGLPDAYNKNQNLEYRIYSGLFKYTSKAYGASLGRTQLMDYEFSQFDGGMVWIKPLQWLKLEGFAGKPYSYGYYNDYSNYWNENEFIGGGGASVSLLKQKLNFSIRYFKLKELTDQGLYVDEPKETVMTNDNFTKARVSYAIADWMKAYVSSAMINSRGRNIDATLGGYSEYLLFNYRLNYYRQFSDITDFGSRFSQFSQFMTAYHPYQQASFSFSKSLADIFRLTGPVSDIELEGSYEYRMPNDSADESRFNPKYRAVRGGILLAANSMCYLNLFYENITSYTTKNDIQAYGGEISKKWKTLTVRLGSGYYAHKYEAAYSTTEVRDSFYAREYYFGLRWTPVKSLDISLKGSYERAQISSLTDTSKVNPDNYTYTSSPLIFSEPREYMRIQVKLGYIF